jgi:hypothetical protein
MRDCNHICFDEEGAMLKGILQYLFGSAPVRAPFNDPVLGRMEPVETGWTVKVVKDAETFEFTIGGVSEPDAELLAHAHDILHDYPSFKKAVRDCVEYESGDYPDEVKAELANLEIDNIALPCPATPNDGMVFFRGSENDVGLWRCDYIDRKPSGLGCDT